MNYEFLIMNYPPSLSPFKSFYKILQPGCKIFCLSLQPNAEEAPFIQSLGSHIAYAAHHRGDTPSPRGLRVHSFRRTVSMHGRRRKRRGDTRRTPPHGRGDLPHSPASSFHHQQEPAEERGKPRHTSVAEHPLRHAAAAHRAAADRQRHSLPALPATDAPARRTARTVETGTAESLIPNRSLDLG